MHSRDDALVVAKLMTIPRVVAVTAAVWWSGTALGASPADLVPNSPAWVKIPATELAARYDTLHAVSDVHGHREELERLLVASGLAVRAGSEVAWNRARARALLLVAGDLIDGGPDSVGVVLLLERLQRQAAAAGSRVVVLLGNHEAKLLAHPHTPTPELMTSAQRHRVELGLKRSFGPAALQATAFGSYLRGLPVAAFVGSWLFAHAGYIDSGEGEAALRSWFTRLDDAMAKRDRSAFAALLDPRSIVSYHRWWTSEARLEKMTRRLHALGMNGVVFGHDPDALGATGTVAINREGWLVKLDAGAKRGLPMIQLRCAVRDIVGSDRLAMMREGVPTCRVETPDGSARPLTIAR